MKQNIHLSYIEKNALILREVYYRMIIFLNNFYRWFFYFFCSRVLNKQFIFVIGDSHTDSFRGSKNFFVHHIGAATAHNLREKKSTTSSNKKLFKILNKMNISRDMVILVFGEIDSRIHIYRQYRKNKRRYTIDQIIERTILNYGEVLKKIHDMGVFFFVYGIPPASIQRNVYDYDYYASPKKRSDINNKFNDKLKKYCKEKGYRYIDIYSKTCDENGFIMDKYAADEVHLNNKVMMFIIQDLRRYGIDI